LLIAALNGRGGVNVEVNGEVVAPHVVPLTVLMSLGMFFTAILATMLGCSLNRENATLELSWTRPLPRVALALRYMAIDVTTLAIAYLVAVAVFWVLVGMYVHVVVEPRIGVAAFMGTGVVAMWYALTQFLTAGTRRRGSAVAGFMWPAAVIVLVVASATHGGLVHDIAVVLNVVNPFAYLGQIGHSAPDGTPVPLLWPLDETVRAAIVWCFALAFGAAAVTIWQRREI
jgi:ABC-type transport system involved in cytochrome c biogenesis permease component